MSATATPRSGTFAMLLSANTILSAAMPMLIILGGLAGLSLAPSTALATLPASVQTLAGLFAAGPFSLLMGRYGRKTGFMAGGALAILGGAMGTMALMINSFWLLCLAHLAMGGALACYQYFRFAAGEVVAPKWQPVAISLMLTSGLVAALLGPQIFILVKDALAPIPFAGAYAAISVISVIGLLPLIFTSLPAAPERKVSPTARPSDRWRAGFEVLKRKQVRTAVAIGAFSQGVMVLLMIPTPLAMIGCGFSENTAGDVVRWHVVAMFAPSFMTGFLIKRFGTTVVSLTGLSLLALAAIIAANGISAPHFYGSLIVLGVGWNFGFIGATSMLAQAVSDQEKALVQGVNDTIIALVSTICAFSSGTLLALFGWTALSYVGLAIVFVMITTLLVGKVQTVKA